jgi:pilus assembly protein CpaF
MVAMANLSLPDKAVRQQISSAIQVVIQVARLSDGSRKLISVSEIVGMEGDVITMQEIFLYDRRGMSEDGTVLGSFRPTGIRPRFADRLERYGVNLSSVMFSQVAAPKEREVPW